ncbi:hypothetical protein OAT74_00075 [Flavobacteriaceae bacterium]|nr:hypothetical protein [Flavobacteriaceae bacterium]
MPFNSQTASLAGKKSKRGKSKITPNIQDRLDLLAAENLDYLIGHLDDLNNTERIKLTQLLLSYTAPKYGTRPPESLPRHEDLPLFEEDV